MVRVARALVTSAILTLGVTAPTAVVAEVVLGSSATFEWGPARGPVAGYALYVERNGNGFPSNPEVTTEGNGRRRATVTGSEGETIRVRVAAFDANGELGPFSSASEEVRFASASSTLPPASSGPAAASGLVNPGFEQTGFPLGEWHMLNAGSNALPGWEIIGHSIDVIGSYWVPSEGRSSVDLSGLRAGGVAQAVTTVPGLDYVVTFDLSANPDGGAPLKSVVVSAGGRSQSFSVDASQILRPGLRWDRRSFSFTADSNLTTLRFEAEGSDSFAGPALDNVSIEECSDSCSSSASPDPAGSAQPASAPQPRLENPGFEETGFPLGEWHMLNAGSNALPGWEIVGHSIDVIGSYWLPSEGRSSVDLSGLRAGGVEQSFTTVPGLDYVVTFDLSANPDGGIPLKSLVVSAGGQWQRYTADASQNPRPNLRWDRRSFSFTASSDITTLRFEVEGPDSSAGPALDNVSIAACSGSCP